MEIRGVQHEARGPKLVCKKVYKYTPTETGTLEAFIVKKVSLYFSSEEKKNLTY